MQSPALPSPSPLEVLARRAAVLLFGAAALAAAPASAQDIDPEFASVDWPPPGPRLRELTERLDIGIGFAARHDWPQLPEAEVYGDIARAEFDTLTPEASLKWSYVHPSEGRYDFDDENDADDLLAFAEANGMDVYGLPLTWYLLNPMWLETLPAERMESVLREHVDTVVSRYAGRIGLWGVVNEGLDNEGSGFREEDPFYAALGPRYMDIAFTAARAADPAATLIYNDFEIGWLTPKSALALELVDDLLARDVPLDGIGMQMHIEHNFVHFEGFSEAMQRFADRGLETYVTELDVGVLETTDYGMQADVYEEVIRRCLMQPRCKAVQIWGLDDFYSWRPYFRPLPFDEDFRVKPAYFGMQRALMSQPVHPENCTLDGARVARGTVYAADATDADPSGTSGDAFAVRCEAVPLGGGFTSLALRYRNAGTDSPELAIAAGATPLATLALPPTPMTNEGEYRTLEVAVPPLASTQTLTLSIGAVSDGSEVGIDALLFSDPTRPLPPGGGADGGTDGGADGGNVGGDDGTTGGGVTDGGEEDAGGGGGGGGAGGEEDADAGAGGEGGGGGVAGPLGLIALGAALGLARRRRAAPPDR